MTLNEVDVGHYRVSIWQGVDKLNYAINYCSVKGLHSDP